MSLGRWTGARVSLVVVGWILASAAFMVWFTLRSLALTGNGGIAAVSGGGTQLLVPVFGPPFALILAWLVMRHRSTGES